MEKTICISVKHNLTIHKGTNINAATCVKELKPEFVDKSFEKPITVEQLIAQLATVPLDSKVCIDADEKMGKFYLNRITYDNEKKRLCLSGPECMNASEPDELDAGANWHTSK
jgi:hypothetical protein